MEHLKCLAFGAQTNYKLHTSFIARNFAKLVLHMLQHLSTKELR